MVIMGKEKNHVPNAYSVGCWCSWDVPCKKDDRFGGFCIPFLLLVCFGWIILHLRLCLYMCLYIVFHRVSTEFLWKPPIEGGLTSQLCDFLPLSNAVIVGLHCHAWSQTGFKCVVVPLCLCLLSVETICMQHHNQQGFVFVLFCFETGSWLYVAQAGFELSAVLP